MIERFNNEAKEWDKLDRRVINAKNIAKVIKENIVLKKDMHIMDFGAGTGLLSGFLSDSVGWITAVDNSKGMIDEFLKKDFPCKKDVLLIDYTKDELNKKFDGIVSSMTIHHIKDIDVLFKKFYYDLKSGGFIAIADLSKEDGTFHSSNEGVFHFGFYFEDLRKKIATLGFKDVRIKSCGYIKKPYKDFEVKCLIAKKYNTHSSEVC
jgi:cyclopropane fatty-acyl-phospholipid synthase-like methyltransferase